MSYLIQETTGAIIGVVLRSESDNIIRFEPNPDEPRHWSRDVVEKILGCMKLLEHKEND